MFLLREIHYDSAAGASWGSGGFTVQQGGSLSLANVIVDGTVTVASGATLHMLAGVILLPSQITADAQATVTRDSSPSAIAAQCPTLLAHSYTTLRDSWRSTRTGGGDHGDCSSGTGVGGGRWYRFAGAGGDALPLTDPGYSHCGTVATGWLSGYPTRLAATPGRGDTRRRRRGWSR